MNNIISYYLDINKTIKIQYIDDKYKTEKQKLSKHLLDCSIDWLLLNANKEKSPKDLEKYLWSKCSISAEDVGFSQLFFWLIMRILIKWIVRQIFDKLGEDNEKT